MRHPKKYYSRSFIPKHGFIANQQNDQLQVGLLAQFVEHCTDITEVVGSTPAQAYIFVGHCSHYRLRSAHHCEDHSHLRLLIRRSNI